MVNMNQCYGLLGVLSALLSGSWALRLVPTMTDGSGVIITRVNGTEGGLCPDDFTLREASVVCRQLGLGWGRFLRYFDFDPELVPSMRHVVKLSDCFGNERNIRNCRYSGNSAGVPCSSTKTIGIRCTQSLPDLVPNVDVTQTSSYVARMPLFTLSCAMEENCLAPSATAAFQGANRMSRMRHQRVLLRFSSIIRNTGTAPFLPLLEKRNWTFHQCHKHYHSMPDFARYAVLDQEGKKIAVGHKSSFCLEDSECYGGIKRFFRCSRVPNKFGSQGISPGCQDTYFHDYDCQWVDITDLRYGTYTFQMSINPRYAVAESNYANNGIQCTFLYHRHESSLRSCHYKHPLLLNL